VTQSILAGVATACDMSAPEIVTILIVFSGILSGRVSVSASSRLIPGRLDADFFSHQTSLGSRLGFFFS